MAILDLKLESADLSNGGALLACGGRRGELWLKRRILRRVGRR
jgi:hypothetical protein